MTWGQKSPPLFCRKSFSSKGLRKVEKKSGIVKILQSFLDGGIDILIGTQMIAKGLDFPGITLVGIINADLGLHMPDFRSSERIFQLIYQAAGRSGRGKKEGEVIIQTYNSKSTAVNQIISGDYEMFYNFLLHIQLNKYLHVQQVVTENS